MGYYKYKVGDSVVIESYVGVRPLVEVFSRYTSDEHNHVARPHKRYVLTGGLGRLHDVSESELSPYMDFDEDRIDIIGQNGNDGEHYEVVDDA